ncbi:rod shape-determining protein MreC, partial [Lactobacillus acidophilus]|nr:rod shape-determining protein MreC [Lactobacillus acidophilus]
MKKFLQNKKLLSAFIIVVVIWAGLRGSLRCRNRLITALLIQSLGNEAVALRTTIVDVPVGFISGGLNSVH